MYAWEAIQETLDYIEENYYEEIDIEKLASIAHLSMYYYQRLFNRLVNKTVGEYIKLRRLAKALNYLKNSDTNILDIALKCGFQSHSNFSKVFKETYSITPDHYRKSDIHLDSFLKPDLLLNYTIINEGAPLIVGEMVLEVFQEEVKEDIIFIGKSKLASVQELGEPKINSLVELWDNLPDSGKTVEYAIDILTPSENIEYFNYFVGVESEKEIERYETRIMPKGKYVVCRYEAENFDTLVKEALYKVSKYLYETWLPNHKIEADSFLAQKYFNALQDNCYIELWGKVKEY